MLTDSDGDLLEEYSKYLNVGDHLAIMPVARLNVEYTPHIFPNGFTFYPEGMVQTPKLNIIENRTDKGIHAERISVYSGIDEELLCRHSLVVFPYRFDWSRFRRNDFRENIEFIRAFWLPMDDAGNRRYVQKVSQFCGICRVFSNRQRK